MAVSLLIENYELAGINMDLEKQSLDNEGDNNNGKEESN